MTKTSNKFRKEVENTREIKRSTQNGSKTDKNICIWEENINFVAQIIRTN